MEMHASYIMMVTLLTVSLSNAACGSTAMSDEDEETRKDRVHSFLEEMQNLSTSQLQAVAYELADASFDCALALQSPRRQDRSCRVQRLICNAIRTRGNTKKLNKAVDLVSLHLQHQDHPAKRAQLLAALMAAHWPHSFNPVRSTSGLLFSFPEDLMLPEGMTQHAIFDACQHQQCLLNLEEPFPSWFQPPSEQITRKPDEDKLLLLDEDHPLTILLHWTLHLHTRSTKHDGVTLDTVWYEFARSLSADNPVWCFLNPSQCWENGSDADIHAYVQICPRHVQATPMYLQWTISPQEACNSISKLHAMSMSTWWPDAAPGQQQAAQTRGPQSTAGQASAGAADLCFELRCRLFSAACSEASQQKDAGLHDDGQVQARCRQAAASYVKQLLICCGLREGGKSASKASHPSDADDQAAAHAEVQEQAPSQSACREDQSRADAVAESLLMEEEAAKAKAQAQKAAQAKRRSKRARASTKAKTANSSLASAQQSMTAEPSGEDGKENMDTEHTNPQSVGQQQQQQQPSSPALLLGTSAAAQPGPFSTDSLEVMPTGKTLLAAAKQEAASSQQQTLQQDSSSPGSSSAAARLSLADDALHDHAAADTQHEDQQHSIQSRPQSMTGSMPDSARAASSASDLSCCLPSAKSAAKPKPHPPSQHAAPVQREAAAGVPVDNPSAHSGAGSQLRRDKAGNVDETKRRKSDGASSCSPLPATASPLPDQTKAASEIAENAHESTSLGRCQPKAKKRDQEAPSLVSKRECSLATSASDTCCSVGSTCQRLTAQTLKILHLKVTSPCTGSVALFQQFDQWLCGSCSAWWSQADNFA